MMITDKLPEIPVKPLNIRGLTKISNYLTNRFNILLNTTGIDMKYTRKHAPALLNNHLNTLALTPSAPPANSAKCEIINNIKKCVTMKNSLPNYVNPNSGIRSLFFSLILVTVISFTAAAQECAVQLVEETLPSDIELCANAVLNGVPGAYHTWSAPEFNLICTTGGPGNNSFVAEFDLPLSQTSCWSFFRVQRTGSNVLRLWQTGGSGDPYFITPLLYINTPTDINLELINPDNKNIQWTLTLLNEDHSPEWNTSISTGTGGSYSIQIPATAAASGKYYLKFGFSGPGNNKIEVDRIYFNAILADPDCGEGINYTVSGNATPGNFFPTGVTNVVYTATYTPASGTPSTATAEFSITVKGVTSASATTSEATCGLNNGSITVSAASTSATPAWKLMLNNNGTWTSFTPGVAIELPAASYSIRIKDESTGCEYSEPLSATINNAADTTPPSFTFVPGMLEVDCMAYDASDEIAAWLASATAGDNCSAVTISSDFVIPEAMCNQSGMITVTWTATDASTNISTATAILSIADTRVPNFGEVSDLNEECDGAGNTNDWDFFMSQFVTNDPTDVIITVADTLLVCGKSMVVTVNATATNTAGNSEYTSAVFTIEDTTEPVLTLPANVIILAGENCTWDDSPSITGMATANDDCSGEGEIAISYSDEITAGEGGTTRITRTWTATDGCDNSAEGQQIITVSGSTAAPVLVLNEIDIYLTATGQWTLNRRNIESITAGSAAGCGDGNSLTYTLSRRYFDCSDVYAPAEITVTATDAFGNSTSGTVQITIIDNIAPVALCKDTTITLDSFGQAKIVPGAINLGGDRESVPEWARHHNDLEGGSIDECGIASMDLSQMIFSRANSGENPVTLTVFDPSGNFATCDAVVTVIDPYAEVAIEEMTADATTGNDDGEDTADAGMNTLAGEETENSLSDATVEENETGITGETTNFSTGGAALVTSKSGNEEAPVVMSVVITEQENNIENDTTENEADTYIVHGYLVEEFIEPAVEVAVDVEENLLTGEAMQVENTTEKAIVTGVTEMESAFEMKLWPNPSRGMVNIDLSWNGIRSAEVSVYSMTGVMVFNGRYYEGDRIGLDLSAEGTGMYLVKVDAAGFSSVKKLLVDRR
jgi:hypothetical protein